MRARFRKGPERVFRVQLVVHRLNSIPVIHRLLHVHWRARYAHPPDGTTDAKAVEPGNVINWNSTINFTITVPSDPSDPALLLPTPLALQLRSERRARWLGALTYDNEGVVQLDLSELASIGFISRNFLVQNSLLNTTLKLSIRITHQSGDKIFRTRAVLPDEDLNQQSSSASILPRTHSIPADRRSKPNLSSSTTFATDTDSTARYDEPQTPCTVLRNSIVDVDDKQKPVYETIFTSRIRDIWPSHILSSRHDASECVNNMFAAVCAQAGIGVAVDSSSTEEAIPKSLSLGVLGDGRDLVHDKVHPASFGPASPIFKSSSESEIPARHSSVP